MGYTTQELQVPINLRISNLQEIMNQMQSQLGNLKVGSKGFKDVENVLARIRTEMDRLAVQTAKPFVNQRQFVTAERSIEKIEDGLSQAQLVMSRLKFSDLNLNSEQTEQIRQFNEEINKIKNNIKNVKEITKQNFLGTDIGKAWLGIDPNAINQNLNQITQSITNAFIKQKKAVDDAQAKFKEYEDALSLKNKISDFTNQLNSVNTVKSSSSIFQGIYDQIFNAQGKFQNGGQTILAQWLSKEFELDETQVSALIQGTASKVIASLKSGQLQELITSKLGSLQQSTSANYGAQLKQELEEARNLLATLTPIYNEVSSSQFGTSAATKQFETALKSANAQLETYQQKQAAAAGANETWINSINHGKQTLQQFKEQLQQTETNFLAMERTQRNFQSIKMLITNFMGFTQVLSLTKTAVRNALNHIKELDSVMNKIAIVTDMSNSDLWKQIDSYSEMSQKYGVSIKGAYEVSQIYYQQGLQTQDVLTLTNETLKLSKISGLDYAQTTDYMTTALRGFKMEMSEASTVVDVYSNLAAHTAVSQEELAVAMSKTASSMESVGATFQEASAMIGTMVAVTRESATNIGSAMKSIAARYGEMKNNPNAISDIEGEAIAYNKVDAALQSVGISLKDDQGQFRNFTDVIIELGERWDTLESTQQRYIATQFAGNRQQSRFLALISNSELLKQNLKYAEDSEDVGDIQALKALDSIETKLEQVKVAYQEMYTTIGAEDAWKGILDGLKNFMNTLNGLPKLFGKVPIGAVAMIADVIKVIKDLGMSALGGISKVWAKMMPDTFGSEQGQKIGEEIAKGLLASLAAARQSLEQGGREAANSAAKGASDALKDQNTDAGKEQIPTKSKVVQTTQVVSEDTISKTQAVAGTTQTIAENLNKAAGAAEEMATQVKEAATATASMNGPSQSSINEALANNTFAQDLMTAVNFQKIDFAGNADASAQFTEVFMAAARSSQDAKAAFAAAGEEAIAEYARSILANSGVGESAAQEAAEKAAAAFKLNQWFDQQITDLVPHSSPEGILEYMRALPDHMLQEVKGPLDTLGEDLATSIAQGMVQSQGIVGAAAATLASSIVATLRSVLNMHSPSPTIIAMFENGVGEAIALGLTASFSEVSSAANNLGLAVSEELKQAFEKTDKINLSDHFEEGDARALAKAVALNRDMELQMQYDEIKQNRKFAQKNGQDTTLLDAQYNDIKQQLMGNKSVIARMNNIAYEQVPVDYVIASHNLSPNNISRMATKWNGQLASPSIAVKPMRDRVWSGFENLDGSGTGTFFFPRQYVDPTMGKTFLYPGDAYTPMLTSGKNYPTIQSARKELDSQPEIGFNFNSELFNVIADATHLPDLSHLRKSLQYMANMPFYYGESSDSGQEGEYRATLSRDVDNMDFEQNLLQSTFAYYLKKSGIDNYNPVEKKAGAELTGGEAFGKALYDTVDMMRKLESSGHVLDIDKQTSLLRNNLYQGLLTQAKIDVPTKFEDRQADSLLSEALSKINFLEQNPRYEFAESKPKTNIGFDELPGSIFPNTYEGYQAYLNAIGSGLNAQTAFITDENVSTGPLSREAISKYMAFNIPNIAFNENGPLVTDMPDISLNYARLYEALNNQLIDSNLSESLMDSINDTMQSGVGQLFANTITAGLSNIDLNATDARAQVTSMIQTLGSALNDALADTSTGGSIGQETGAQIIAGMMLGLSSGIAELTSRAQGAGQAVIAALNEGAGVASPSVFAFSSGKFIMLGLTNGMMAGAEDALDQALKLGKNLIIQLDTGLNNESGQGIEKIKNRLRSRLEALTDITDEEKAKILSATNNLTWDDYVKARRNPQLAGIDGSVTQEGIRYVTSHPILTGEMAQTVAPTLSTQPMIEQAQAAKTVIENTAAPTVQEHLDTTAVKSEAKIAKKEVEAIQQNYNLLSPKTIIAKGNAIRDRVLNDRFGSLSMTHTAPELQARERTSSYELDIEKAREVLNIYLQIQELRKSTDATTTGSDTYNKLQELYQSVGTTDRLSDNGLLERINGLREALSEKPIEIPAPNTTAAEAAVENLGEKSKAAAEKAAEAWMSDEEIMEAIASGDSLYGMYDGQSFGKALPVESVEQVNTELTESILRVQGLVDKLVELGIISQEVGEQTKQALAGMTQEQLAPNEAAFQKMITEAGATNAAPVSEPVPVEVDTSAAIAQLSALIDKLVEIGVLSEEAGAKIKASLEGASPEELANKMKELEASVHAVGNAGEQTAGKLSKINFSTIASAIRMLANISGLSTQAKGAITALGGAITLLGVLITAVHKKSQAMAATNPWMAIAMGVMALVNGISMLVETTEERIERLSKAAEEATNKAKKARADYKNLANEKEELDKLAEKRYESAEAAEEYQNKVDNLVEKFPELIAGFDATGNAILDASSMEVVLQNARQASAEATLAAAKAERKLSKEKVEKKREELGNKIAEIDIPNDEEQKRIEAAAVANQTQADQTWWNDTSMGRLYQMGLGSSGPSFYDESEKQRYTSADTAGDFWYNVAQNFSNHYDKEDYVYGETGSDGAWWNFAYDYLIPRMDETNGTIDLEGLRAELASKEPGELSAEAAQFYKYLNILFEDRDAAIELLSQDIEAASTNGSQFVSQTKGDIAEYAAEKGITSDTELINSLKKELSNAINSGDIDAINHYYNMLNNFVDMLPDDGFIKSNYGEQLNTIINSTGELITEYNSLNLKDTANVKTIASASVKKMKRLDGEYMSFVTDRAELLPIVSKELMAAAKDAKMDIEDYVETDAAWSIVNQYETFWLNLAGKFDKDGNDMQEMLGKMLSDTRHYSAQDIIKYLGLEEDDPIALALISAYSSQADNIRKQIRSNIEQKISKGATNKRDYSALKIVYDAIDDESIYTTIDQQFFNRLADEVTSLADKGFTSESVKVAELGTGIYSMLQTVDELTRNAIMDSITESGFKTAEGIQAIIDTALDAGIDPSDKMIQNLIALRDMISNNLKLTVDAAIEAFSTNWQDSSKTLKKLTSGIEFTDMESIISDSKNFLNEDGTKSEFKLTRSDFVANGSKLALTEEKAIEYWEAYSASMRAQSKGWQDTLDKAMSSLTGKKDGQFTEELLQTIDLNDEETRKKIQAIMGDSWESYTYLDENGQIQIKDSTKFIEALNEGYEKTQESINTYNDYLGYAGDQIIKAAQWSKGNFSSLNSFYKYSNILDESGKVIKSVSDQITSSLMEIVSGTRKMTEEELKQPDVANAVKQIRSAYGTYINDLVSKDIKTLYAEDYVQTGRGKEQIAQEMEKAQRMTADQFAQWIAGLSQIAGDALETQNDNFVKAWEKVNAKDTLDGLDGVQFLDQSHFSATTDQLKTFANTYGLKLSELVATGITWYDKQMGQWVVNYARLDELGLDLTSINGFKETVADSINDFFKNLGTMIKNALDGSISNVDAKHLQEYATQMGFEGQLDFSQTAEGLKLSEQSAISLYATLKKTNALQASLVFKDLRESLEASNEHYKSISANEARIVELERKVNVGRHNYSTQAGNVDLVAHARHQINGARMREAGYSEFTDDSYATLYTTTYSGEEYGTNVVLNITPITNDGTEILSPDDLDSYVTNLMENSSSAEEIMLNDTKHLVMGAWDVDTSNAEKLAAGIKTASNEADRLHKESDAIASNIEDWDKPNDARIKQYEEELALAKEIRAERSTTEDSSFDFMNNKIPAAQNNPITYFENWGKAWKTLKDSFESTDDKGLIGYQDFYNIITEMGNIAAKSGVPIQLGAEKFVSDAESAAALINEGAQCLTVASDGSIKVNLSKFGLDFEGGADAMADNVDAGIQAIAKSQIDMLDSMIQLMETIVAMEQLGDIDLDSDNTLDLGEIFKVKYDEKGFQLNEAYWDQFTDKFKEVAGKILADAESNEDLMTALKDVVVNGYSLHDMFQDAIDGVKDLPIDAQAYTAVMNAFYKAAISGDYNLDNIMASVKEVLAGTGFEGEIVIGDYKLTFQYGVVLEEGKDGKYHVGDKTFNKGQEKAAARATAVDSLDTLKNAGKEINGETGEVKVTSQVVANVDYDVDTKTYTINFVEEGYSATATSKAGADLAIATYARLTGKNLDAADTVTEPITFTLHQEGAVDVEVTLVNGEVTTKIVAGEEGSEADNSDKVAEAAQAIADEKAAKAAEAASGTQGSAQLNGLTATVTGEAKVEVDLTGATLTPINVPETIELTTSPKLVYPAETNPTIDVTGLKGFGTGTLTISDCELTFDENGNAIVKKGNAIVTTIPVSNLTGTGTGILDAGSCTLTYNAATGEAALTFAEGESVSVTIPADKMEGHGVVSVENCSVTLANNTLTITTAEGESISVTVPSDVMKAVGNISESNCTITFSPNGNLTISNNEGKTYTVTVPSNMLNGIASLLQAKVGWESGEKFDTTDIVPETIDLGTVTGIVTVNEVKVNTSDDEQFKNEFGRKLANARNNPSFDVRTSSVTGIEHDVVGSHHTYGQLVPSKDYGGVVIDETKLQQTERYVALLKEDVVTKGGILSDANRGNLENLYKVLGDTSNNPTLATMKDTISEILAADTTNLESLTSTVELLANMPVDDITTLASALDLAYSSLVNLSNFDYEGLAARMALLVIPTAQTPTEGEGTEQGQTTVVTMVYDADTSPAEEAAAEAKKEIEGNPATETIKGEDEATAVGKQAKANIDAMTAAITITASNTASSVINNIKEDLNKLVAGGPYRVTVEAKVTKSGGDSGSEATGNIGLAKAQGTLMGELGPELVVSGGRYFVAGQNGPEMVNLADDAIVFNHLQTKSLLEKGTSLGRGKAITNERNAIAFATGNINGGPAMASAGAALAALKQLRSMWQALLDASVKDLAGAGGGGGGGGGNQSAFIKDLERWYDWLQHIAKLEKDINYYEAERNRISSEWAPNGRKYYESQKNTLGALRDQLAVQNSLTKSQEAYFEKRRKELNEQSAFSALYGFSESGQLYYKDVYADGKSAFEWLSDLAGRDATTGEANYTAEEQYNKLVAAGFGFAMKYDSSGNEIKQEGDDWYSTAVQAFWDKIDADKEEMQSLYDAVQEGYVTLEDLQQQQNEILREMRDNQMDLEQKVYDAIVDIRERAIDELKDTKEAIDDQNSKFIDGLSKALQNEQNMYNNAESRESLDKLRNKRDILLRSGGSAAQIASLNEEIEDQEKSVYFDKQQEEIDAIQAASDKQIEKLDAQINLETEILEYQKKYGLLWAEVTDIMGKSPEEIARFISENDQEYWNKSPVASADALNQLLFSSEQWVSYRDDGAGLINNVDIIKRHLTGESDQDTSTGDGDEDTGHGEDNPPGGSNPPKGPTNSPSKKKVWKVFDEHGIETNYTIEASSEAEAKKLLKEQYGSYLSLGSETTEEDKKVKDQRRKEIEDRMKQQEEERKKKQEATETPKPSLLQQLGQGIADFAGALGSWFGFKPEGKATGGYVNHGVYELGERGTEAVLTASQTKILRDNILGNKPNSLINLLASYNDAYKGLTSSTYDSISNNSNATEIKQLELNLNVDSVATKDEARQAAHTIMDELLRISSKTSANNSVRR